MHTSSIILLQKKWNSLYFEIHILEINIFKFICILNNLDPVQFNIQSIMKFLTEQFNQGAKYGTLNSMRAAIALSTNKESLKNQELSTLFKWFFNLNPPQPRYSRTWDLDIALEYRKLGFITISITGKTNTWNCYTISCMYCIQGSAFITYETR